MATRRMLPTAIQFAREDKRLEDLATSRGYDSLAVMLYELYVVEETPLKKLASDLFSSTVALRRRCKEYGIEMRSRGGRNNVKIEITEELVAEASREGVAPVAERLGVYPNMLEARLRAWWRKRNEPRRRD